MGKFIDKVVQDLISNQDSFENLILVIPGNRPKLFFQNAFVKKVKNVILPQFLSIDDFILEISGLQSISQIQLWFQAYESYQKITETPDEFDNFLKWIPTLLKDFDDINSALVNPHEIFDYLVSAERIKKWGHENLDLGSNQLISKHLYFWKMAKDLFFQLNEDLLQRGLGYRGLIYQKAVENLPSFTEEISDKILFVGLNALSSAEQKILFHLQKFGKADFYWDSDQYYMDNENQEAGQFLRRYKAELEDWKWDFNDFIQPKNIEITSVSKRVGQAKFLHQILQEIPQEEWTDTVVVLADESFLPAVLSSVPSAIDKVNITMGFPLNKSSMAYFFRSVFELQMNREKLGKGKTFYYKNVIDILGNQIFKEKSELAKNLKNQIQLENRIFSSSDYLLKELVDSIYQDLFKILSKPLGFVDHILKWTNQLMRKAEVEINELDKEYLYRFSLLFTQLKAELGSFQGVQDFKTLYVLYNKLLQNETISFVGEPLEGLQIVGLLETRLLDFKNVIMTSVNDGVIPPGRVENTFIPFDIRRQMKMNTFTENDAIFAYHFYRLLQRAENIQLVYNSEADALGTGEKSRFITQIEIESGHNLQQNIASASFEAPTNPELIIEKTETVMQGLENWLAKGISPSSLNNYLRNPLEFYQQRILGLKEFEEAEETVGARILGNVVHETLEDLYTPLLKKILIPSDFDALFNQIESLLEKNFKEHYKSGEFKSGKNFLIYKIAYTFVENVLKNDQKMASETEFSILELELECETEFQLNHGRKVKLKGVIDRIDSVNGKKRIIDYKTGTVKEEFLRIKSENYRRIFNESGFDKPLQLFFYAYLYYGKFANEWVNFGIYPLKYPKKEVVILSSDKEIDFNQSILEDTSEFLSELIEEILNPAIPFRAEREIDEE
jgi:ATP-dependent helicase/nuclease subunit B